jgi:hypothetical protein
MPHELEPGVVVQVIDIALVAGEEIVEAQNLVPLVEQTVDQMRTDQSLRNRLFPKGYALKPVQPFYGHAINSILA